MVDYHIYRHPILAIGDCTQFEFSCAGRTIVACEGEKIASSLFANSVGVFRRHHRDGAPQGMFCANGQCAQCTLIADGLPARACVTLIRLGVEVQPLEGGLVLPPVHTVPDTQPIDTLEIECLVIGAGPAGLSAAIELGRAGVRTLIVDDKHRAGGRLVLQAPKFLGSMVASHAGMRGVDIARGFEGETEHFENVRISLNTTAVAAFSDLKVELVRPYALPVATGALERSLSFPGDSLPGVYGAGAFQTIAHRDLVHPAERLFIFGGGQHRADRQLSRAPGRHSVGGMGTAQVVRVRMPAFSDRTPLVQVRTHRDLAALIAGGRADPPAIRQQKPMLSPVAMVEEISMVRATDGHEGGQ